MRVAMRVDASPEIGGGHAMRCLTLADALAAGGATVRFMSRTMPEPLGSLIRAAGHELVALGGLPEFDRDGEEWHQPPLNAEEQQQDASASAAAAGDGSDWFVVDHYLLAAAWERAVRTASGNILVIDDLANREHECDILLDQTLGRSEADYRPLVSPHARVLAGSHYALLRPEFAREWPAALKRRQQPREVGRILISLGTTDVGGITSTVLEQVSSAAPECAIDVVLGPDANSLARVQDLASRNPAICVHVATRNIAQLMRDADLAIGAAGTTSWERCCLGLPTVTLVLAENQRPSAEALERAQAAIVVQVDDLQAAISALRTDKDRLTAMSAAAFAIADGHGAARVVQAIRDSRSAEDPSVEIRPAAFEDAERLWLWRNDPLTRTVSRTTAPIAWHDHSTWFRRVLSDTDRRLLIGERSGTPVGMLRFDPVEGGNAYEVSIAVAPEHRGTGVGRALLQKGCADVAAATSKRSIYASVHPGNSSSQRLFETCGFQPTPSTEGDEFFRYRFDMAAEDSARRRSA